MQNLRRFGFLSAVLISLIVLFQNCSGFNQQPTSSSEFSSVAAPETPPPVVEKVVVTVGVGVNGRRIVGTESFANIISEVQQYSMAWQRTTVVPNGDLSQSQCPATTTLTKVGTANVCCFSEYRCFHPTPGDWHSDFLLRGAAVGDNKIVAVGGASFGIVQVSSDGGRSWSEKYNLVTASGLLRGTRTQANYLSSVVYAKGKWIALQGYQGELLTSTDAVNWTTNSGIATPILHHRQITFINDLFYTGGERGAWGVSEDGERWSKSGTTGSVRNPIFVKGFYYGIDYATETIIKRTADIQSGQWDQIATASQRVNSLVYLPASDSILAMGSGIQVKSSGDFANWAESRMPAGAAARLMHFDGSHIVGQTTTGVGRSPDNLSWKNTSSAVEFDNPLIHFTSGLIDKSVFD